MVPAKFKLTDFGQTVSQPLTRAKKEPPIMIKQEKWKQ